MFKIDSEDKTTIKCTRGDKGTITISKKLKNDGTRDTFKKGDKIVFSVKNNFGEDEPVLRKVVEVEEETEKLLLEFTKEDTTIGDLISSPVSYQYEISIGDDCTILGYDDEGPKIFKLYPEGGNDE